jgi:dipeptidase D
LGCFTEYIIEFLIEAFKHGVHEKNEELGIPETSINLAIINTDEKGGIVIESSARAMGAEKLDALSTKTLDFLKTYGFEVALEDKYPAWKPEITDFTELVSHEMKAIFGRTKMMAIHAGLECGVIAEKYPDIKFASIGPTIRYPHSTREMVNLESVERTYEVLKNIIRSV